MSVFNNCDLIDSERTFNIAKVLSLNIVKIDVPQNVRIVDVWRAAVVWWES